MQTEATTPPAGNAIAPSLAPRRPGYGVDNPLSAMASRFAQLVKAENISELAALRRLDAEHPDKPAFFRMLATCVPHRFLGGEEAGGMSQSEMTRRFAAVAALMALRPDRLRGWNLGEEMFRAGVSEERLSMLLAARGDTFRALARRLTRRLARDSEVLPYLDLCRLILLDGRADRDDEADDIRIAIARDYQRAARRDSSAVEADT
jgi:CRISPR system Cascade subunit CasB